jgi:hypothetical protein
MTTAWLSLHFLWLEGGTNHDTYLSRDWTSRMQMCITSTPIRRVRDHYQLSPLMETSHASSVIFLERLLGYSPLPSSHINHLGEIYHLSTSPNSEIRLRFYQLALLDPASEVARIFAPIASGWVVGEDETGVIKGRMKFCRPIFRSVFKVDGALALGVFTKFQDQFHPIARKMIEKVCSSRFEFQKNISNPYYQGSRYHSRSPHDCLNIRLIVISTAEDSSGTGCYSSS